MHGDCWAGFTSSIPKILTASSPKSHIHCGYNSRRYWKQPEGSQKTSQPAKVCTARSAGRCSTVTRVNARGTRSWLPFKVRRSHHDRPPADDLSRVTNGQTPGGARLPPGRRPETG